MAKKQKDLVYPPVVVLIKSFWKYLKLKFDFAGVENIPTDGGAILAINHVGYLDFAGDMDTAIAIRTAVIKEGKAYVQAGAGVVADSDPQSEHQECINKASAVLRAIAVANTIRDLT